VAFAKDLEFVQQFPWVPTVDGEFLTDTPYNLISQGRFQHKDALLGSNADEGTFWILFALPGFSKDGPSLQNLTMFRNGVDKICWDLSDQQVPSIIFFTYLLCSRIRGTTVKRRSLAGELSMCCARSVVDG